VEGFTNGTRADCLLLDRAEQIGSEAAIGENQGVRKDVVWTPELDAILREGYARGWSGAREAVNRIQRLRPKWWSHIIWDRAKQLGFKKTYVCERPPWSAADDAALMDFAQEQSVKTIASWLHRTESAARKRFSVLGESARVRDNYTQLELARDLRVSPKTVRRWEAAGVLQRRDGRITHESLKDFCKSRGSGINYDALDKEMQRWLKDSVGFVPASACLTRDERIRKHLQKVGVCPRCGRRTRGNAHGQHVKACARKTSAKKAGQAQHDGVETANGSLIP
jgi:transcriptional regulator with XRE-family HTH domain